MAFLKLGLPHGFRLIDNDDIVGGRFLAILDKGHLQILLLALCFAYSVQLYSSNIE